MTFLSGYPLVEQWQFHILHSGLERDEVKALEDETNHMVSVLRRLPLTQVLD